MILLELSVNNLSLAFPVGHKFSEEAGRKPFKDDVFSHQWENLIESGMGKIYAAVEYETEKAGPFQFSKNFYAVALLGAVFLPDPFSGEMTAAENFWYVLPEHRKSGVGLQLLDRFESDAKSKGCTQILMVHFAHMGAGLARLYESRGYKLLEQTFKKEI